MLVTIPGAIRQAARAAVHDIGALRQHHQPTRSFSKLPEGSTTPKSAAAESIAVASTSSHAAASATAAAPLAGDAKAVPTKAATGWSSYVPWGRKLTGSEKFYWGLGLVAAGLIGYKRWSGRETEEDRLARLQKEQELEAAKKEFIRAVLAGASFLEGEDPFKGLRPRQIQKFVEEHGGELSSDDPFEGMSPEEIDEYVAKHGLQ